MPDPSKTVFISYRRRAGAFIARSVFQDLRYHRYDVFMDVESIDSGAFDTIILRQIEARAHFVLVLAPETVERCAEPGDWLRREIEHAIDTQRNIVPLLVNGFTFNGTEKFLTGKLSDLQRYNGLEVPHSYFDEAMNRLRKRYLKQPMYGALVPTSEDDKPIIQQKIAEVIIPDAYLTESDLDSEQKAQRSIACDSLIRQALNDLGRSCANLAVNRMCYGHEAVVRTTSSGIVSSTYTRPGDRASIATTHRIQTSQANVASGEFGVNVMNVQAGLPAGTSKGVIYVQFGGTTVENIGGSGQNVWQSIYVSHSKGGTPCADAPDFFFAQSPKDIFVQLTINGAPIELQSSITIMDNGDNSFDLRVVDGVATVRGVEVTAGNRATIQIAKGIAEVGKVSQLTPTDIAGLQILTLLPENILNYKPVLPGL